MAPTPQSPCKFLCGGLLCGGLQDMAGPKPPAEALRTQPCHSGAQVLPSARTGASEKREPQEAACPKRRGTGSGDTASSPLVSGARTGKYQRSAPGGTIPSKYPKDHDQHGQRPELLLCTRGNPAGTGQKGPGPPVLCGFNDEPSHGHPGPSGRARGAEKLGI